MPARRPASRPGRKGLGSFYVLRNLWTRVGMFWCGGWIKNTLEKCPPVYYMCYNSRAFSPTNTSIRTKNQSNTLHKRAFCNKTCRLEVQQNSFFYKCILYYRLIYILYLSDPFRSTMVLVGFGARRGLGLIRNLAFPPIGPVNHRFMWTKFQLSNVKSKPGIKKYRSLGVNVLLKGRMSSFFTLLV
jgi:hypothetical protein